MRSTRFSITVLLLLFAAQASYATYCAVPKPLPLTPPADPPPPICEPNNCDKCSKSPCYLSTGVYVNDVVDLQIPTAGMFPLIMSRRYDSSRPTDGPLGAGWSSSITAHLYYAAYLVAAPSTYTYEADVVMPDGVVYRFGATGGSFTPPLGTNHVLVRNADGTYSLTLQQTRSVYRFNADGSLASLTDDYGSAIAYTYDGSGRVQQIADSAGSARYINVTWGADGRIASLTDNTGRVYKYFYNADAGTLTGVSDPIVSSDSSSRSTYYTYVAGRFGPVLSRIADRWQRTLSNLTWNPDGRLRSYTDGDYNDTDPTSSSGEKFVYTYDNGDTTKANSLGHTSFSYMSSGLLTNDQTQYSPTTGRPTVTTDDTGASTSFTYDATGYRLTQLTRGGVTWSYTYDPTFPDQVATILPQASMRSTWAGWKYDYVPPGSPGAGAVQTVYRMRTDGATYDVVASYSYDAAGRVVLSRNENGTPRVNAYDAAGNLTKVSWRGDTSLEYDALGRLTKQTSPSGQVTTYTYDAVNRITSVTLPKPSFGSTLDFTTRFTYDDYDTVTALAFVDVTDPNGRVTRKGYDALGHIVRSIDALGNLTAYTFQYNMLKTITDANQNVTSLRYDANRNLSSVTYPDGASESYVTGSSGTLLSKTDRRGMTTAYGFDLFGRIATVTYSGVPVGGTVTNTFGYTGQNLTGVTDNTQSPAISYSYTYDSSWRLSTEQKLNAELTTYAYMIGNLVSSYTVAPPSGTTGPTQTVTYTYDGAERVTGMQWSWLPTGRFQFAYNADSQYSTITFPNNQKRVFTYDGQGRLVELDNFDPSGAWLARFDYAYDYDWNVSAYAMLGQQTSVTIHAPSAANQRVGMTQYVYDANYELVRAIYPTGDYDSWTYDAIGNRTGAAGSGPTSWQPFGIVYPYFKNGSNPNNGQRMAGGITYDPNGNMTHTFGAVAATWDYQNRLTAFGGATYTYNYRGERLTGNFDSTVTRYIHVGLNTVGERNSAHNVNMDYLFAPGIDEPLAKRLTDGTIIYYDVDGLGTVAATNNASGTIVNSWTYSPWGQSNVPRNGELFGYAGREYVSPGSGQTLWYNRAREYDPVIGRFLSEEPAGNIRYHPYAYVENNPIYFTDPSGATATPVSYHGVPYDDVAKACGFPPYVKALGCTALHLSTKCSCSPGCALTGGTVWRAHVSLSASIDVYYAQNCVGKAGPAYSKAEEQKHVGWYGSIVNDLRNAAAIVEAIPYSSYGACSKGCAAYYGIVAFDKAMTYPATLFIDFTHPSKNCDGTTQWW
jgi:RHS repeat-associated protein